MYIHKCIYFMRTLWTFRSFQNAFQLVFWFRLRPPFDYRTMKSKTNIQHEIKKTQSYIGGFGTPVCFLNEGCVCITNYLFTKHFVFWLRFELLRFYHGPDEQKKKFNAFFCKLYYWYIWWLWKIKPTTINLIIWKLI